MRLVHSLILLVAFSAAASSHVTPSNPVTPPALPSQTLLDLPVTFERNAGQFSAEVDFVSRAQGQALSVNASGATVLVGDASGPKQEIRLRFEGARRNAPALDTKIVSYANYISGNDRSRWLTGVTAHENVRYDGVYDGIDVEYHARRGALEYDLIVAPGADWRNISIAVDGATPTLEPNGDLLLCSGANQVRHLAPYAYQNIGGKEVEVESRYELRDNRIAFVVGDYDRSQPLVIDPVLDFARGVFPLHRLNSTDLQRDAAGNLYLVATVWSPTATTLGGTTNGYLSDDILVAKLSPDASQVLFQTYIGGSADERTGKIALGAGDVFVTGVTYSGDFPTTAGAFGERVKMPTTFLPARVFVTRLDGVTGAVDYSTYLEKFLFSTVTTEPHDIAVDPITGQAVVSGSTSSDFFPVTPGAYRTVGSEFGSNAFLTKFAADGKSLVFSTLLYGSGQAIAVDADGFIYVGGGALFGLVTTPGAYQETPPPTGPINYIMKMTPGGTPVFVTYAPGQNLTDIALDSARNIVAAVSPGDRPFPVSANAFRQTPYASLDVGIFKLSTSGGTLISATYFGGSSADGARKIAVGPSDTIYLTMQTASGDIPMVNPVQGDRFLLDETVLAKFDANLTTLLFSTYYGPSLGPTSVVDTAGNIYLMVINGGKGEDGIWLKGTQIPYGHYATTQIARILLGAGAAGFAIDYVERLTAAANVTVDGKFHVRGTGFQQGASVFFGTAQGITLSVFAGGTAIKFRTPSHPIGVVDVTVKNPDNSSVVVPQAFVYQQGHNSVETVTGTMDTLGNGTATLTATRLPTQPFVRADLRTDDLSSEQDLAKQIISADATSITFKMGPMPNNTKRVFFEIPHPHDIAANVFTTLANTHLVVTKAPVPTVSEARPNNSLTAGGGSVTVIGSNFHPKARVMIGRVFARGVTFVNSATLLATIPPNSGGLTDVIVINPDYSAGTLPNGFTYRGITSITPGSGPISGNTNVTIIGQGFTAPVSVSIGGAVATNVTLTGTTQITAKTGPRASSGIVDVVVSSGSDTFTLPSSYRYLDPPPTVSSVTPPSGPDAGGTSVAINGFGFLPGAKVFFDGLAATSVTVVSGTRVDAVTPPMVAGSASVKVENFDGQSHTGFNVYTYTGIDRLSPVLGSPGTVVTVFGAGFVSGATVTLGGTPATNVEFVSGSELQFTVPAATPGIVDVVVNSGPLTLTKEDGFRILAPPPTVTGFTPNTGLPGSEVILTGTNFVDVLSVNFSVNAAANFTVDSPTQITAIVPNAGQTGTITVNTDSGTATSAASYTVENAAAEIATVVPAAGAPGTLVTITGVKMGGATSVKFNGTEATTFTLTGTTEIKAVVPEGGSTGPICITTPGPFTGCSAISFRYPPTVTGFSPPNALPGDTVTITGFDFVNVISLTFNSTETAAFSVNPAGTSITATVPAAATTGPITVTAEAGAGFSSTSFGIRPVITSFTPARSGIGTTVTITGLRFGGATNVTIGGSAATFTVISDTQIQATVPASATDGPIFVVTPGGSATSSTSFSVALTPIASSFSPTNGPPGTLVAISGQNFNTTTSVHFNGTSASFTIVSDVLINATVPAAATTGPIALANDEGEGVTATSFYLPPVLSSFAPNAGAIGSTVTLSGNNFNGTTSVTINNATAAFTVNAQNKITLIVPDAATTGPIKVTTPGGSVTSPSSFSVGSSSTPTVIATATSASQILVTWTGDPTHAYQVMRTEQKGVTLIVRGTVTGNDFVDTAVVPGKTYLYTIRNASNGLIGNADTATTILFTDDPLTGNTRVKLVHLTQLRAAVNAMRFAAGLPAKTWTDTTPVLIRRVHINEMRTALSEAYIQLYQYVTFTDEPIPPAMVVRGAHFSELRTATK
ncbi:MAG TPA: IPT/TIG domain-containing protein [Thermoanaerobaculia bacterium]|nr:IPT/TIG domain-containing protein [Thermoanaerobaculia bacterium]